MTVPLADVSRESQTVTCTSDQSAINWGSQLLWLSAGGLDPNHPALRANGGQHSQVPWKHSKEAILMNIHALPMVIPTCLAQREQTKMHSSQFLPGMALTACFPSYCPRVRNWGALYQQLEPKTKYRVSNNRFTVASMWNTEFILVSLFINYCIIFHMNNCKPVLPHQLYISHYFRATYYL